MCLVETLVEVPVILVNTLDSSDNDVANEHAGSTDNQESFTTELVKPQNSRHSEDDLQDTGHTSSEESLLGGGETETLENLGSVVEDGIDTSELLANHGSAAEPQTLEHVGSKQSLPGTQTTSRANKLCLTLLVEHNSSLDLEELM